MSLKAYKFRIYPTHAQETTLNQTLETCRRVYNRTLALRKDEYEQEHKTLGFYDTEKYLVQWKKEDPTYLSKVHSQVLQNVQMRVDLAFKAFFRRVKQGEKPGYPRFKGYGRYDSFTYPQAGSAFQLSSSIIKLSKIGDVKIKQHREVIGNQKTCTISRSATGKWSVSIVCEIEPKLKPEREFRAVGIDLGVKNLAVLSNGEVIKPPRFYMGEEKELVKAQRKMDAAKKGSKLHSKRRKVVARIHERITNKRKDFCDKLSLSLVQNYSLIVFEDLKTNQMIQQEDCYIAKHIYDVAWNQLINMTTYKAEDAGSVVVLVNPYNTTKMCSQCGTIIHKSLKDRVHDCPVCGLKIDRDHNAAINILRLGMQSVGSIPKSR